MAWITSKFLLSPHKLVLCVLLNSVGAPRTSSSFPTPRTSASSLVGLSSSSRHRLALVLLHFFKSSGSLLEPSYEELEQNLEKSLVSESPFSEELRNLLVSITSVEDLSTLFLGLRDLLAPGQRLNMVINDMGEGEQLIVDLSSTLGLFLRRCILSFNQLSFEGACKLLREMKSYCESIVLGRGRSVPAQFPLTSQFQKHQFFDDREKESPSSFLKRRGHEIEREIYGGSQQQGNVEDMEIFEGEGHSPMGNLGSSKTRESVKKRYFLRTSGEVEAYLSEQAVMVERKRCFERASTDRLVESLSELKELAFHIPQVHYLQYLNSLFQRDYPAAMESLHRFFDFSAGEDSMPGSSAQHGSGMGRLQAGLLGLGQMHSDMGHTGMALQALNDSILIAQQNNDNGCLLHALAALCSLFSDGISTDDDERSKWITYPGLDTESKFYPAPEQHIVGLLNRCLRRALELKLPQLIGFSRLSIAKIKLQHIHKIGLAVHKRNSLQFGTSPVEVCRILRVNGFLLGNFESNNFRMNSGTTFVRNLHTDMANGSVQASGMAGSLGATGWGMSKPNGKLGTLARSVLKLCGTSQLLRASCWERYGSEPLVRASALMHISCYADVASADDLSLAYIKMVRLLISLKGHSASQDSLALISKRFPLLSKSRVRELQLKCMIEWALLQGDLNLAQMACGGLLELASVVPGVDVVIKIQASSYNTQRQLAACQYKEAALSAQRLFLLCFKGNKEQDSVELLLLTAEIHKKAGSPVTGLPYVLAALTLCQSLNLDLLQASANVLLAGLWIDLGMFAGRRALVLLHQCMPVVLGHGSLQLQARAHLSIAHCYLNDPSFSVQAEPNLVLDPLQTAVLHSQVMEDVGLAIEALYLLAIVLDTLGRVAERDKAALDFQGLMLQHKWAT